MYNHKICVLTISTVAGPEDRSRNVCLPDPKFPLPFFPLDFSTNAMKYQRKKEWGLPMNLYRGLQLIIVVLIILLIINNDLMMDLIRNISPHEGLNKKHFNVLTQWQHYRNPRRQKTRSLGHGVEFLVTSYKDLQHSGCGYTINAHELSSLGSVYFLWYQIAN